MKKLIAGIIILFAFRGISQTITGADVTESGDRIRIYITGLNTNGSYALGWSTNNYPVGNEKIRVDLTSPTFTKSGNSMITNTLSRQVFGSAPMRYGAVTNTYELTTAGGIICHIFLSDYVFQGDSSLSLTATSGWYTQGGSNAPAASSLTVTNNSIVAYPVGASRFLGGPGFQRFSGPTMRLYAMSAASQRPWPFTNYVGKPMAGVEFKVSDTLGNSSSVVVDSLSLVPAYSNVLKSAVYYADVVITNLTPLVPLRCDITTYPLIGNSSAVFSTTNNLFTGITSAPSAITNMYDPTNAYSKAVAVVSTSGSDTLGRVGTNDPTVIPSTNYFLTWAKAAQAIRTNNAALYGHDDTGGGFIYGRSGDYPWLGSSQTYGTQALVRLTLAPYPGDTNVAFTTQSGNADAGNILYITNLVFRGSSNALSGVDYADLDNVVISNTSSSFIQSGTVTWIRNSEIQAMSQGIRPFSIQNTGMHIENCNMNTFDGVISPVLSVGNYKFYRSSTNSTALVSDTSASVTVPLQHIIWYNNYFALQQAGAESFYWGRNVPMTNAAALIQNCLPITTNVQAFFNYGGSVLNRSNVITAHNTIVGGRVFYYYNDTGTNTPRSDLIGGVANVYEMVAYKGDLFAPVGATRTNNWAVMYGLGHRFNVISSIYLLGVDCASFPPYFMGMGGYHPGLNITNDLAWLSFSNRVAAADGAITTGQGNFHINTTGPIWTNAMVPDLPRDYLIPYDMDGVARTTRSTPGPFATTLSSGTAARNTARLLRAITLRER